MKKNYLFILALLLIFPFSVFAATTPRVLTVTASNSGSKINYNGTTEDGVHAVMCKLFNSQDEEIDMLSSSVDNNAFSGSFNNVEAGTYNVACARYEGGEVKKAKVVVGNVENQSTDKNTSTKKENKTTNKKAKNPNTYDAGIFKSVIVLIISISLIIGFIIYLKKNKKQLKR